MEYVADKQHVAIRSGPSEDAPEIGSLKRGDELEAAETLLAEGLEWVRLPKSASVLRDDNRTKLKLEEDGFVQVEDPDQGTLLRKKVVQVLVDEIVEEGALSKREIQEILDRCHNSDILLPLESKYWTKQGLELYVMSGGTIRPKWCSMPDEAALANAKMTQLEVEQALAQAAAWLATADAVLVGSGAGMGVDSGLSTFRGKNAGVWPGLENVGLAYEEICHPRWFTQEPHLAWGFWNFCHEAYQATTPHKGYSRVKQWADQAPLGVFSFTSNIDSHWAMSGWGEARIVEVHGAVRWLQCSKPCCVDVWKAPDTLGLTEDETTHRVKGRLPTCPKCSEVARPDVQMFGGDTGFSKARRSAQVNRYDRWLKGLEGRVDRGLLRVVCLELGCGLTVPTVRKELESVMSKFPGAKIVRVNPENPGLASELKDRGVSLPLQAGHALEELEARISSHQNEQQKVWILFIDDKKVGMQVEVPINSTALYALHRVEKMGTEVVYGPASNRNDVPKHQIRLFHPVTQEQEMWQLTERVPARFLVDIRSRQDQDPMLIVGAKVSNIWFKAETSAPAVHEGAEWCIRVLGDCIKEYASDAFQNQYHKQKTRKSANAMIRRVMEQVLPDHGLEGSRGVHIMHTKIGLYGAVDDRVWGLAGESMRLSHMREIEQLPWDEKDLLPPEPPRNDGTRYYTVGSWDEWRGMHEMKWDGECFCFVFELGEEGRACFQIVVEKDWKQVLHPNIAEAGDKPHRLRGPDDKNHGLNWLIQRPGGSKQEVRLHLVGTKPTKVDWQDLDPAKIAERDHTRKEREREEREKEKAKEREKTKEREPEWITVSLKYLPQEDDDAPDVLAFPCMSNTTLKELRGHLAALLCLSDEEMGKIKFLMKFQNTAGYGSIKEHEAVKLSMYTVNMALDVFSWWRERLESGRPQEEWPRPPWAPGQPPSAQAMPPQAAPSRQPTPASPQPGQQQQPPPAPPQPKLQPQQQFQQRPNTTKPPDPPKPARPADPLKVALTRLPLNEGGPQDTHTLDLTRETKVEELRAIVKDLYQLDDKTANRMKFLRKLRDGNTMMALAAEDMVKADIFVMGVASLKPPAQAATAAAASPKQTENGNVFNVTVHLNRLMDIKHSAPVPAGTTVWDVKVQLAAGDPTGKTRPEDFALGHRPGNDVRRDARLLKDDQPITSDILDLDLMAKPEGTQFTRERAVALQKELHDGFAAEDFQTRLREIEGLKASNRARYQGARQKLVLSVQKEILPKYGFRPNLLGVRDMINAFRAFDGDPETQYWGQAIEVLLPSI